jgi:PAB-dependent poly(A)-specific ribonuclease subunit 2
LDPVTSHRPLVTLQASYRKLWLLLNLGCVFIGHGLANDFRTINIQVPATQVIDTVDIYYVKSRQRKLSLKFLAWYLLDEAVQTGNHDSIEDARTALRLYRKYIELKDRHIFDETLHQLYHEGQKYNFKPPTSR